MSAALKLSGQKGVHDFPGLRRGSVGGAQAKDIGVVVLAGQLGHLLIQRQRGAHAGDFIGGHAHPDARRTDQNPQLTPPGRNGFGHRLRVIALLLRLLGGLNIILGFLRNRT